MKKSLSSILIFILISMIILTVLIEYSESKSHKNNNKLVNKIKNKKHSKKYNYDNDSTLPSHHYEKKITQSEQYVWVAGDKPSGLPGSFVVSEEEATGGRNNEFSRYAR